MGIVVKTMGRVPLRFSNMPEAGSPKMIREGRRRTDKQIYSAVSLAYRLIISTHNMFQI